MGIIKFVSKEKIKKDDERKGIIIIKNVTGVWRVSKSNSQIAKIEIMLSKIEQEAEGKIINIKQWEKI